MNDERIKREFLRSMLADVDEPCPVCEYNLRGLGGTACPECGEELVLRIGLAEPKLRLFIAGLLGLAFGAGFHGLVFLWAGWMVIRGNGGPQAMDFARLLVGVFLCGAGLVAWLRLRQSVRRATRPTQVVSLLLCWLVPAITAGAFMAYVS